MHMIRSAFRNFPAASRALLIALSASALLLAGARLWFHDARPSLFLLGDSFVGNYRMVPGERLEDHLERMNPGMKVESWGQPGATPLDFFLQFSKGCLVAGKPQAVVVALSPDKFLEFGKPRRLGDDGATLRWLPWDRTGLELFRKLSPREKGIAVVQQANLVLYGIADMGRSLWVRYAQWPWDRSRMRVAPVKRRRRIEKKMVEYAESREGLEIMSREAFADLPRAQDAHFLFTVLRKRGIKAQVIILPFGNPDLMRRTCSPEVLAKQDTVVARMRDWLEHLDLAYIDLSVPEELAHFPDPVWDDMDHLKDASALAYISRKVSNSLGPPIPATDWSSRVTLESGSSTETIGTRP